MPAPLTRYCTDYFIYAFLNKYVTPLMCKYNIHPNVITILNMVWVLIMFMSYKKNVNKYTLLLMMVFYHVMDCLDGNIARKCDKKSFTGLVLDHIADSTCLFMYLFIGYDLINKNEKIKPFINTYLTLAAILYVCFLLFCLTDIFKINVDFIFHGKYKNVKFIHDNGVLCHVSAWIVIAILMT